MNSRSRRWRQLAVKFVQHASFVLPSAQSPWADAMRRELDYIVDDPAALRWAFGCILASYKARIAARPGFSARGAWRYAGPCGALMLLIIVSLQGHARGQTEPPRPAFAETACDLPNVSPEVRPRLRCGTVRVPRDYANRSAGQFKLAVVVIKSEPSPSLPDPVVYISGGPGEPLTIYADHQARMPYAPGRDPSSSINAEPGGRSRASARSLTASCWTRTSTPSRTRATMRWPDGGPPIWRAVKWRSPTGLVHAISAPG